MICIMYKVNKNTGFKETLQLKYSCKGYKLITKFK